jgi:hypothetical protein
MWLHKGRCMSADDKNLKLNFWGTKRHFLAILIRRISGVVPRGAGPHRLLPFFSNWGHTCQSDFPSQSYGHLILFLKNRCFWPLVHFLLVNREKIFLSSHWGLNPRLLGRSHTP